MNAMNVKAHNKRLFGFTRNFQNLQAFHEWNIISYDEFIEVIGQTSYLFFDENTYLLVISNPSIFGYF